MMYARIRDKCVMDISKGDGSFMKVNTGGKTITQYPFADRTCSRSFQVDSFADEIYSPATASVVASGPLCRKHVLCQGVSTALTVGGVCEPQWSTIQVFANERG